MTHSKNQLIVAAALVLMTTGAYLFAGSAENTKEDNRFAGKYVTIYLKGTNMECGHRLKDVQILDVGGIKMLVGSGIGSDDDDWTVGVETYVPLDTIGTMFAMTPEQYQAGEQRSKSRE